MKISTISIFLVLMLFCYQLSGQQNSFGPCSSPVGWNQVNVSPTGLPENAQKILIVTNRPYLPDASDQEVFFNEVSDYRKVTYLLAACESGSWQMSPVDDFLSGMNEIDCGQDILLFVHGHGKAMPPVLTRANQIRDRYDVSLVVFDWPSFHSNFNKSLSRVRRCGENFYNLLLHLQQYRNNELNPNQHLSMLLHSLGNYYLTHLVVNGNNQYMDEKIFDNIIMNSPAVRSKEHGEVISQLRIQDQLYVVFNHRDKVLRGAHLLTSGKMLGNVVIEPLAPNATYVDFGCVAGTEHTYFAGYHQFEFDLPAIEHFFYNAFHGRKVDFSEDEMFLQKSGQPIYIVKDPGKECLN